jgi:membrane-bound lytic murein transglycosylase C
LLFLFCAPLLADSAYDDWKREHHKDFARFRQDVERRWRDFQESTDHVWVRYGHDGNSYSSVNFGTGKVTVAVIVEHHYTSRTNPDLDRALGDLLMEPDSDGKPLLAGQITYEDQVFNGNRTSFNLRDAIAHPDTTKITGQDGRERTVLSVNLSLVPNHVEIRAKRYEAMIEDELKGSSVPKALVMAMIHRESLFNPRAFNDKSGAVGLMQIVPPASGRFMNKRLNGIDAEPGPDQLLDPRTNLRYGIGYLSYLYDEVFAGIENSRTRLLCVEAGYRFGSGAVSRSIPDYPGEAAHWHPLEMDRHLRRVFNQPEQVKYFDDVANLVQNYGGY